MQPLRRLTLEHGESPAVRLDDGEPQLTAVLDCGHFDPQVLEADGCSRRSTTAQATWPDIGASTLEVGGAAVPSLAAGGVSNGGNVAAAAQNAGAKLVHISGIGADPDSASPYVRSRAGGEVRVRDLHETAVVLRPSVMFGPGDAFLTNLAAITARTPVVLLFGRGDTQLQPVFVEDVASAVIRSVYEPSAQQTTFELGGPEVLSYRTIVERVLKWTGRRRLLVRFPWPGWKLLAVIGRVLPSPPVTEGQLALIERDNVVTPGTPGLDALGVTSVSMSQVAPLLRL